MEIYYLETTDELPQADIACVVLDKRKSYVMEFKLAEKEAKKLQYSEKELKENYLTFTGDSYYDHYKLMDAKTAKEKIVNADLKMHLPIIQQSIQFGTLSMF